MCSFAAADHRNISPFHEDGVTYGIATWIRSVVAGGDLHVRPSNGPDSRWCRATVAQQGERVRSAGTEYNVRFALADDSVLDAHRTSVPAQPRPAWNCGSRGGAARAMRRRGGFVTRPIHRSFERSRRSLRAPS
ncbi:hypothetical protein B6E66_00250 [Streptomyces maremycinicus]|nr:hypothetical protein B6E66_00250 [Streptomyces sp. B9173]